MVEFSKLIRKNKAGEEAIAPAKVPEKKGPFEVPPVSGPILSAPVEKNEVLPAGPLNVPLDEEAEVPRIIKPLFAVHRAGADSSAVKPAQPGFDFGESASLSQEHRAYDGVLGPQDAQALYDKLIGLAQKIYTKDVNFDAVDTSRITMAIAEAAGVVMGSGENLVELSVSYLIKDEASYLLQHAVNVCVISLTIGSGLNYEIGKLIELGLAAFLHDIGMVAYEELANVPRPLTAQERDKIQNHVHVGDRLLKKINPALSETILTAQYEIHERLDGTGYPTGRRMLHDYAKIISLADAFESMIHPRPFRDRYSIMEVYKRIFEAKNKYDQQMIKVLVERLGFFPNGSFVQLNTKEVGRVVAQNHKSPLRPVIRLLYDDKGEKLYDEEVKDINMVKYPTLHIVKCFLQDNREH